MIKRKTTLTACFLLFTVVILLTTGCVTPVESEISTQTQTQTPAATSPEATQALSTENASLPTVYFTSDISPEGLIAVYDALGREASGNVAVKVSTGERGGSYYLNPNLIGDLVQSVNGTIVECNTAYGGSRSDTEEHLLVAEEHGFTAIAPVEIMDANGSLSIPVTNGTHLTENFVGSSFDNYDFFIVLSHFKGHAMAGFGGALKNEAIGIASSTGKIQIHSGGTSTTNMWGGDQTAFLESMAEAAKSVSDYLGNGENVLYINVMNNLSIDCDCDSHPAPPEMEDVGILASLDPVALDQACVDIVYTTGGNESLVHRIEERDGIHLLEYAEQIGLGSRTYQLVNIDE